MRTHEQEAGHIPDSIPLPHKVEVIVDGRRHEVKSGAYVVADFKQLVNVPVHKELDEIVDSMLKPLDDHATIVIVGHEVFISHERTGAAS